LEGRQPAIHPPTLRQRLTRREARRARYLQRLGRWLRFRFLIPLLRTRHAPEFTARGVANGVFWGLTPTVGLQTLEIVTTWFVARKLLRRDSSLVQALVWVWINNPLTMVPMYYTFYLTGLVLIGNAGGATGYDAFLAMWTRSNVGWVERITTTAAAVAVPTIVGCIPYAVVGAAASYFWAVRLLRQRERRA
jgi:uncharacterized protein (DUF2062 family)